MRGPQVNSWTWPRLLFSSAKTRPDFPQVLRSTLIFQLWWVDQSIGLLLEFVTVKKKAGWLKGKVSLPSG